LAIFGSPEKKKIAGPNFIPQLIYIHDRVTRFLNEARIDQGGRNWLWPENIFILFRAGAPSKTADKCGF